MSSMKFDVEKFNGKNDFGLWKIKMEAMLIQQGLAKALKGGKELSESSTKGDLEEMQQKARSAIILCLGDKVLREVAKEMTAAGIWAKLESLYMTKSLANRLYMKQHLYSYRFSEEKGIEDQLEEFNKSIDDLENIDVKIEDEDKAILLLNALPKSFEHLKDAMLFGRENVITLEEVQNALRAKELQKVIEGKQEMANEALNVNKFKKFKAKKPSPNFKKGNQTKNKEDDGKETRKCHYCKKPGHLKKDCYSFKKKQTEKTQGTNSLDIAENMETAEILNIVEHQVEHVWILDSGCSFHMCPNRGWFSDFRSLQEGSVLLGNDQVCHIRGIGNIRLKLHDGSVKILSDVRFIPNLKRNLISLGTLESKGYNWRSENGCLHILRNSELIMKGVRKSSLYYLVADTLIGECESVSGVEYDIWHARLGHIGERGLNELVKQNLISCSGKLNEDKCDQCIMGKNRKKPFGVGVHISEAPLDYAHADLWGPARTESLGGGKYFLSIIDDFSRKLWVYVIKHKDQTFQKFKEWNISVEVEQGKTLKCLRTDNGLEFLSKEFGDFCKEKGIKRHRTIPGIPQQNGVVERMNRTILEKVRCMLLQSGVPKKFWGEAVNTAANLINKSPSSAIKFSTPDFMWYKKPSSYSYLRTFGCLAFAHIKQDKLDARAVKCILLGYQDGTKGYRLWCYENGMKEIYISRDVTFKEKVFPFLSQAHTPQGCHEMTESSGTRIEVEHNAKHQSDQEEEMKSLNEENLEAEREDLSEYIVTTRAFLRPIRRGSMESSRTLGEFG